MDGDGSLLLVGNELNAAAEAAATQCTLGRSEVVCGPDVPTRLLMLMVCRKLLVKCLMRSEIWRNTKINRLRLCLLNLSVAPIQVMKLVF